jgi:alkanesulfonate monooxygenase SsuD/methylene tetrahydromethanopterin reductase-like flavin-dependent oxidoreductase (luciferase family)
MPPALKIGVQLPEVEFEYDWPQLSGMAKLAEDSGYDSIWLGDHLMYRNADPTVAPVGPYEAWTTLAALAAITTRVELGPLVASLGFHNPAMIAKMAATIDQISNGRFILGIGSGWNQAEYLGYGFPFDHRVDRFEESFAVIRQFFETGACDFDGQYVQIENGLLFPRLVREGGPPMMVGSHGKRMLEITLPHVPMWNAWFADYDNSRGKLPALLAEVDEACERVGRDPSTLEKTICPLITLGRGELPLNPGRIPPTIIRGDDPNALADEFNRYAELGVAHLQLVLDPITPGAIESVARAIGVLRS